MSITEAALQLAELDRRVVRDVVERNTEDLAPALEAYITIRRNLRTQLLEGPVLTVESDEAATVLRKIGEGDGLPTDRIIRRLLPDAGELAPEMEFDEQRLSELGDQLFYSWFSHHEYVTGLAELRPLIHPRPVPEAISKLVRQIQDVYAFQQYDATYALCRTVIEVCIRDICVRRHLFPDIGKDVVPYEKYQWSKLRDRVSEGPLRERLRLHYARLSTVLHGRESAQKESARVAFQETLELIEKLYQVNEL